MPAYGMAGLCKSTTKHAAVKARQAMNHHAPVENDCLECMEDAAARLHPNVEHLSGLNPVHGLKVWFACIESDSVDVFTSGL
jgi:hypothetical protein